MSRILDNRLHKTGTRFKLYLQSPVMARFAEPETVWLSPTPGSIGEGPSDARMYAVDALKKERYEDGSRLPFDGKAHPPAKPGKDGHFDHIDPSDRAFLSAHMYAGVRRVLDIWEGYAGAPIEWHFRFIHDRLELIPSLDWRNAHFGLGFMEMGYEFDEKKKKHPYALNFDVLSHETGHGIVWSLVGMPMDSTLTAEYLGFLEASADLVCLISVLHFESLIEHVLSKTAGNLYLENELNRIGETSEAGQLRHASNALRLSDVPDTRRSPRSLSGKEIHKLCDPLTGAVFDLMIAIYQENLVEAGLIDAALAEENRHVGERELGTDALNDRFRKAYDKSPAGFIRALADARDTVGLRLVHTWKSLSPHNLTYSKFAARFLTVDRLLSGDDNQDEIIACFQWRQIGPGFESIIADERAKREAEAAKSTGGVTAKKPAKGKKSG